MNVVLKLKRANTLQSLRQFSISGDFPSHCKGAAITLFVADVLFLRCDDASVSACAVEKLAQICLMTDKVVLSKLAGGVPCTIRVAAFTAMLAHMWSQRVRGAMDDASVLRWAADHCLHGNVRDTNWTLTDVMYALESLVCHWESVCQTVWNTEGGFFADDKGGPADYFDKYLTVLWLQCAKFVVGDATSDQLDSPVHTLPYQQEGSTFETSVSPDTVMVMSEVWRSVEKQRRVCWHTEGYVPVPDFDAIFARVFDFERNQLTVDKFRENLRARLAKRHLMLGDAAIWSARQGGKDPDIDLVVGERCTLALAGYVQHAASVWTYEKMVEHAIVRDELFRMMTDSHFQSCTQVEFSCRFFEDADDTPDVPRRGVVIVQRVCHGFTVVVCDANAKRVAITPPLPFAHAFLQWALAVSAGASTAQYGEDVMRVVQKLTAAVSRTQ